VNLRNCELLHGFKDGAARKKKEWNRKAWWI
jgi:hypothetical protein